MANITIKRVKGETVTEVKVYATERRAIVTTIGACEDIGLHHPDKGLAERGGNLATSLRELLKSLESPNKEAE